MVISLRKIYVLCVLLFICGLASCSGTGTLENVKYKNHVLQQRKIKNTFFKESPESPLLEEQQWRFTTLHYYPVNVILKLNAQANLIADQTPLQLRTSTGHERFYVPRYYLEFEIEGQRLHLTAYQQVEEVAQGSTNYFVPFTDLTSGEETYGAGRYLEFDYGGVGAVLLDFNFSYNPYCAYNFNFSCPIPPPDNHLNVAVKAGEMTFVE
nr:DUF1684 domain-containing protein [Desulfobulbaceae bacterium]